MSSIISSVNRKKAEGVSQKVECCFDAQLSFGKSEALKKKLHDSFGRCMVLLFFLFPYLVNIPVQTWNGAGQRSSLVSQLAAQGLGAGLATGYAYWPDGLMRQEAVAGGNFYFNFGTNSLLTSRQNPGRTQTVTSRDLLGRILTQQNSDSFSESQSWSSRGQRSSYAATKSGLDWNGAAVWSGSSNYYYNGRGQLYSESDLANNGAYGDYQYRFDNEPVSASLPAGAGLGVRTSAVRRNNPSDYTDNLTGSWLVTGADSFKRPTNEQAFTSNNTGVPLQETYDSLGQVLTCQLADGNHQVNTWDAFGRLIKVAERDSSGSNGFDWTAIFDTLGRRIQTVAVPVGTGSPKVPQPATITSYFDPQVEFLELGLSVNGTRTWKVYGPDLSGRYGGLQGIGGLEATIDETTGNINTLVNDVYGNVVGSTPVGSLLATGTSSINISSILSGTATGNSPQVTTALMVWNPAQVNSYGVTLGSSPAILGGNATLTQSILWRSMRLDPTGNINMGGRYYKPATGRFLSPDPLGHSASMDLYSYAGGDPVNGLDPTGRCKQEVPNGALVDPDGRCPQQNSVIHDSPIQISQDLQNTINYGLQPAALERDQNYAFAAERQRALATGALGPQLFYAAGDFAQAVAPLIVTTLASEFLGPEIALLAGEGEAAVGGVSVAAKGGNYGVSFFDAKVAGILDTPTASLGRVGDSHFFMPLENAAAIRTTGEAARETGMAPSVVRAYTSETPLYGVSFPTNGLTVRMPTAADANGWVHYLEGGNTAVFTGGKNGGYLINSTREFVTPGGGSMPNGSVLFRTESNGAWTPIRRY